MERKGLEYRSWNMWIYTTLRYGGSADLIDGSGVKRKRKSNICKSKMRGM